MKKSIKIMGDRLDVTARNERETRLARIFNNEYATIIEFLNVKKDDPGWTVSEGLKKQKSDHFLVTDLSGILASMFFLDMICQPVCSLEVWQAVTEDAKK